MLLNRDDVKKAFDAAINLADRAATKTSNTWDDSLVAYAKVNEDRFVDLVCKIFGIQPAVKMARLVTMADIKQLCPDCPDDCCEGWSQEAMQVFDYILRLLHRIVHPFGG